MPKYVKSRARKEFDADVDRLIRAVRDAFSSKCKLPNVREHVLASVMLQGSAKMEFYLTSLISDWVDRANASALQTDDLPLSLRAYGFNEQALAGAYAQFLAFGSEVDLLERLAGRLNNPSNYFAINGQHCPELQAEKLWKDRKYPSGKNLKILFNRFGIAKIFDELAKSAKSDLGLLLDSFNDVRAELAHEGIPPGLTPGDIRSKLRSAQRFISHVDRVFFKNLELLGAAPLWTP